MGSEMCIRDSYRSDGMHCIICWMGMGIYYMIFKECAGVNHMTYYMWEGELYAILDVGRNARCHLLYVGRDVLYDILDGCRD